MIHQIVKRKTLHNRSTVTYLQSLQLKGLCVRQMDLFLICKYKFSFFRTLNIYIYIFLFCRNLDRDQLTGTIPSEIATLKELRSL